MSDGIPVSQKFVSLTMKHSDLFLLPWETEFGLVVYIFEDTLIGLTHKEVSGELLSASGALNKIMVDKLIESFGWSKRFIWQKRRNKKCIALLENDIKQAFKSNNTLHYEWATFKLTDSGSIVWISHPRIHDPGLNPPTQSVCVELPNSRKQI